MAFLCCRWLLVEGGKPGLKWEHLCMPDAGDGQLPNFRRTESYADSDKRGVAKRRGGARHTREFFAHLTIPASAQPARGKKTATAVNEPGQFFQLKTRLRRERETRLRGVPLRSEIPKTTENHFMKNITDPRSGKILLHDTGLGELTDDAVASRAREIAAIEGRSEPTKEDIGRAGAELRGTTLPVGGPDDVSSMDSLSRDPSEPPAQRGRQVPNYDGTDEEIAAERLVTEGVEEAQHDQMFAARRKKPL
jgi:hypothetical protein